MFTDDELIKKKDIFDPIEDDDDIDLKHNPFDVDSVDGSEETPEQLIDVSDHLRRIPTTSDQTQGIGS
jgi:hypothetical protein